MLITTAVPSTLKSFLLPYARHYRALGWRVDAACNGCPACGPCVEAFDQVHQVPWTRRPLDPVNFVGAPRVLRRLVRENRYDLVHTHDPIAAFVTRLALRRRRRSEHFEVVYTAHGFHFYRGASLARNLVFRTAESMASRWTDYLVVINHEDLDAARRFPIDRERVVYMPGIGVDIDRYDASQVTQAAVDAVRAELGLGPEQHLLLMIAEFTPRKRHADAVEALARSRRDDVVLAFAGEGPLLGSVQAQAARLGVSDRIRWLGYRDDVPVLLRASIGLMLPSELEGLPRCIMEASALERPAIASRIRGTTELVNDHTGILFAVGDVEALAQAIDRLAGNPDEARAMGIRSREAVLAFDLRRVVEEHDALYERVLGGAWRAPPESARASQAAGRRTS
jgi:glycosyltransferase involved in cell wall biosynthesis